MLTNAEVLQAAVRSANECELVFTKFLSANDTGLTGGHQCGIYIPKNSVELIFDEPQLKGVNQKRSAEITWNANPDCVTQSSFTYYGQGTRDEYRITRFGRGFPFLRPEHTGDLIVICKHTDANYSAFVLSSDSDIQEFLDAFSLSPVKTNCLLNKGDKSKQINEIELFNSYYMEFGETFPSTRVMALAAEEIDRLQHGGEIDASPDAMLVRWIETEFRLFQHVENCFYEYVTQTPAENLDAFIRTGLEITNRRKSRAGKSLEHHLAQVFEAWGVRFSAQPVTEMNKKPDFIFPSEAAYHDVTFNADGLTFLGAKTTCKDRWRQVLNEANRIPQKYLFTLQQGVSPQQLDEMHEENLVLVVPKQYHKCFPKTDYISIISLEEFIGIVKAKQERYGV